MSPADPTARPDIERALLDPPSVFETPEALLEHPALTPAQKIEILRRWAYDAADIAVAVEEGMPGAEEPLLRRITLALQQLAGPLDLDQAAPSKQHGLARGVVKPDE
jgi:hypothetical protein